MFLCRRNFCRSSYSSLRPVSNFVDDLLTIDDSLRLFQAPKSMDQRARNRAYQIIEKVLMNEIQPKDENMLNGSSMKFLKELEV